MTSQGQLPTPQAQAFFLYRRHDFWVSLEPLSLTGGALWAPKGARGGHQSYTIYTLDT